MKPHEVKYLELDHLREELHRLELRVEALEHPRAQPAQLTASPPALPADLLSGSNPVPAAGRAVLGLAGAFLLRALAESGSVSILLVAAIAILYAAAWLVFAVRTRPQDAFARTTYSITAVLILVPLLWEATVRFNVLAPAATAGVLIAFFVLSSALLWKTSPGAVAIVTTLAILVTALALMVQTGSLVPFATALLAIACVVEVHATNMRIPVAIAADFAIWLVLFVMTRPGGAPEHYQSISVTAGLLLCALLFAIYIAGTVWRTAIGGFEIVQSVAVFILAAGGALQLTQGKASTSVGVMCAVACAACYLRSFYRNHHFFASCGAALALVACVLLLPQGLLTPVWGAAAVFTTLAGARTSTPTLGLHGALYLLAAGLTAGVPIAILNAYAGAVLQLVNPSLWIFAISAACCYAACFYTKSGRAPAFVSALFAAASIGALLIFGARPAAGLLATARTLVICLLALLCGFVGARAGRRELVWLSYVAIALGTVKLVMEDFRLSHPAALAVSLVCYGALLILLPKLSVRPSS
jgi:hypothetical protein